MGDLSDLNHRLREVLHQIAEEERRQRRRAKVKDAFATLGMLAGAIGMMYLAIYTGAIVLRWFF